MQSAELVAEELAARVSNLKYEWDGEGNSITLENAHIPVQLGFDETSHTVTFQFRWFRREFDTRKNVKKWLPNASEKAASALRSAGWNAQIEVVTETPGCSAEIPVNSALKHGLDKVAEGISLAVQALTF